MIPGCVFTDHDHRCIVKVDAMIDPSLIIIAAYLSSMLPIDRRIMIPAASQIMITMIDTSLIIISTAI
jgi:hypothetical protein